MGGLTDCGWSSLENNSTVALVSQEFADHMIMHTLNVAIAAVAGEGMERQHSVSVAVHPGAERSCTECCCDTTERPELLK